MPPVLKNATSIVSGATGGLGKEIAHALWLAGSNLVITSRFATALEELQAELMAGPRGGRWIDCVAADLAEPDASARIVSKVAKRSVGIDVLINSAAIQGPIGPVWQNDWAQWTSSLQVNLLAVVDLCRRAIPLMAGRRRGKIINLSGGGATNPRPNFSAYAVAKAGLVRFSETLAHEVHALNIDVNCVAPGVVKSQMTKTVLDAGPEAAGAEEYTQAAKASDAGSKRAASLCVFLASAASDGISGKLISAVWDPWPFDERQIADLATTDIYTLRRIVPKERGRSWDEH